VRRVSPSREPSLLVSGLVGLLLVAAGVAAVFARAAIVRGPYLNDVRPDSIVVRWDTDTPCVGTVRFTPRGGEVRAQQEARATKRHEVRLHNLAPGARYLYQVGDGQVYSPRAAFRTAVPAGQAFSFAVYGDSRSHLADHRQVANAILAADPAFVLHTGDLVSDGHQEKDWAVFFDGAADLLRSVPVFPCLGNHEQDSQLYFDYFSLPGNERYYSFDYGDCHFIALDSNALFVSNPAQRHWLAHDLQKHRQAALTFAFLHHPPYSVARHGNTQTVQQEFCPLFRQYGVDVVFAGHDHDYQRNEVGGVTYIVTAGGGASLYDQTTTAPWNKVTQKLLHYVLVRVYAAASRGREGKSATLEAFTPDGQCFDRVELGR